MQTQRDSVFSFRCNDGWHLYHYDRLHQVSRFSLIVNNEVETKHSVFNVSESTHLARIIKDFNDNCLDIQFSNKPVKQARESVLLYACSLLIASLFTVLILAGFMIEFHLPPKITQSK